MKSSARICPNGHSFIKTSDCPTCPKCEQNKKPKDGILSLISAPARRAFESIKIKGIKDLSKWTEKEILGLHGVGPSILKIIRPEMEKHNIHFKKPPALEKKGSSTSDLVSAHIRKLPAGIQPAVQSLREIILSADKRIAEHIKWNSPAFYFTGKMEEFDPKEYKRDIAVLNLHKGRIMIVLPTGSRINDNSGLLEGSYADGRRMITFTGIEDIRQKQRALTMIIKNWIRGINH